MKRFFRLLSILLAILTICLLPSFVSAEEVSSTEEKETDKEEFVMRAAWIRPGENTAEAVEKSVQALYDLGINTIFLETIYNGYAIYPIEHACVTQWTRYEGFDVLQAYIDACHKRGMQLHCWMESFFVGMEDSGNGGPVVAAHPDWLLCDKQGNNWEDTMYGKMYFLNPAKQECRDFLVDLFMDIVNNYDVDGMQLDYVRYPEKTELRDYGFDSETIAAFMVETGNPDPTNHAMGPVAEAFVQYKRDQVTKFVQQFVFSAKKAKPEITISFSVAPDFDYGESNYMQSVRLWMQMKYGQLLVPMCYDENAVASQIASSVAAAGGDKSKVLIGLSAQSRFSEESMLSQIEAVRKGGCGIAFFEGRSLLRRYANAIGDRLKEYKLPEETSEENTSEEESKEENLSSSSQVSQPSPRPEKHSFPWEIAVGLGIALAAAIGLLFFWLKKKK